VASRAEDLTARYQEIDHLMGSHWRSPEFRRWQAATTDALRKALGFHPTVVEFAGLRFRAGTVQVTAAEDVSAAIPAEEHAARMRQDLVEAKKLLRRALAAQGVDVDALPALGTDVGDPVAAAAAADPALAAERRAEASEAGRRLGAALAAAAWAPAARALQDLLGYGPTVGKAAVEAMAARMSPLR